ncbi:MAG TPA: histidine phosphatase family protein [Solirubrobacteraceae bacterium]|nr:histidine phosphatase family protein [Solirubrobacteraceae bacterium]
MERTGSVLLLVRHGETEWSRSGQHTGSTDLPLLDDGRAAAQALGRRLAGREFALRLSSPLMRARDTAGLAGLGGAGLEITEDLVELGYGEYEGRTTRDIRADRPGWDLWSDGAPGGEPLASAGERVDRVIERVRATDGDAIVFAHGHILRILGARWVGRPPAFACSLGLDTAALCELGHQREHPVIWLWNDTTHLPR